MITKAEPDEAKYHYRVRILDPAGHADKLTDFGDDLANAKRKFLEISRLPGKRTAYLDRVDLKTGKVKILDRCG